MGISFPRPQKKKPELSDEDQPLKQPRDLVPCERAQRLDPFVTSLFQHDRSITPIDHTTDHICFDRLPPESLHHPIGFRRPHGQQ